MECSLITYRTNSHDTWTLPKNTKHLKVLCTFLNLKAELNLLSPWKMYVHFLFLKRSLALYFCFVFKTPCRLNEILAWMSTCVKISLKILLQEQFSGGNIDIRFRLHFRIQFLKQEEKKWIYFLKLFRTHTMYVANLHYM